MGMIVEQPSPDARPSGLDAVHAVLRPALNDLHARERREAVRAVDPRDDTELSALFTDLDALIDALRQRLASFQPPPVPTSPPPRPPRKSTPALELNAFITARARTEVDDLDSPAEAPPLPSETSDAEPPPLPPPLPDPPRALSVIPAMEVDTPAVNLLYDDIVWLVSIDDWAGALISLERLLVMAKVEGQIKEFVDVNEVKLLNVYESYLGPFSKIPVIRPVALDNTMPPAYQRAEKIRAVIELIDEERSLSELMRDSPLAPLETCSVINQLRRSGVIAL